MTQCGDMFFFTLTMKGIIFLTVEESASPFSSGFVGKYFFSAPVSSGFGAEGEKTLIH